jgi:hypothetical protein
MNTHVVSVMVRTARDNMYLMSEDMSYGDACELVDDIECALLDGDKCIRLPPHTLIGSDSVVSVRIMPAEVKRNE